MEKKHKGKLDVGRKNKTKPGWYSRSPWDLQVFLLICGHLCPSLPLSFIASAFTICSIQENTAKSIVINITPIFYSKKYSKELSFCFFCLKLWLFGQDWAGARGGHAAAELHFPLSFVVFAYMVNPVLSFVRGNPVFLSLLVEKTALSY